MPVQINEMIIRAHIDETAGHDKSSQSPASHNDLPDKEAIIKECTEIILELLNRKNER